LAGADTYLIKNKMENANNSSETNIVDQAFNNENIQVDYGKDDNFYERTIDRQKEEVIFKDKNIIDNAFSEENIQVDYSKVDNFYERTIDRQSKIEDQ
jgi:hypothetical protein